MKAMILAAGRGERMRPLTDTTPKPLLRAGGAPLIEHHLRRLGSAGVREAVINVSHLGEQVEAYCGDGGRWGLSLSYSREESPLETAGGILQALPLLGDAPFLVVNGDIYTDCSFDALLAAGLGPGDLARLVLVDNPPHHPLGDFHLDSRGRVHARQDGLAGRTYAGVGVYSPQLFDDLAPGVTPLRPLLDAAIDAGRMAGEYHGGDWEDVGTPERLAALDARLSNGG